MWETVYQWFSIPANIKLLLGVLIAFGFGIIIGRWFRNLREEGRSQKAKMEDKAFIKGIQYILSNEHDSAIEEFTKSIQVNSNTVETYVALGNLYRSRGDIGRSIRIRQSIILRPNISEEIKVNTLFDLGLDYRKGGFINRALNTFLEVLSKRPSDLKTLKEIERIYEELKDWENAYKTRQKISKLEKGDHRHIIAHYLVEMGKVEYEKGVEGKAASLYKKAMSVDRECVDAYLHLGDLQFAKQEYKKAISTWKKVVKVAPHFTFLAYRRLEGAYTRMKDLKPVEDFLKDCASAGPDPFTHMALARYLYNEGDVDGALREINTALELDPFIWEARRFKGEMLLSQGREEEALEDYGELVQEMNIPYLRFQCSECGLEFNELQWQCPQCKKWDTMYLANFPGDRLTVST